MFPMGCNPGGVSASETNAILTIFDQGFDYEDQRTYILSREVSDLCLTESEVESGQGGSAGESGAGGEGGATDVRFDSARCTRHDSSLDDDILEALEGQMEGLGYRQVNVLEDADVVVLTSAVARSYWFYSIGYQICDEFLGDECWEPSTSFRHALPYGSLLVTWIDGEALREGDVESAWLAAIPGVFGSYANRGTPAGIQSAMNQAFLQSPYLEVDP
jgi:hypothetical protein